MSVLVVCGVSGEKGAYVVHVWDKRSRRLGSDESDIFGSLLVEVLDLEFAVFFPLGGSCCC